MQNRIPTRPPSLVLPSEPEPAPAGDRGFTELDAAEQLIQLSESTGGGGVCCCSAGSATSVNEREEEEDDDDEGLWRKNKRYRMVEELYAATARIDGGGRKCSKENNKKRK